MKLFRVYADTSVFGGCFDEEFAEDSKLFFNEIKAGKFILVISSTVLRELDQAPAKVQKVLNELPSENVEIIESSDEISYLRNAYLEAGILSQNSEADAEHIASASVADVDFVVSWNFKHIVHFEKIVGYQAVNLLQGYKEIRIYSPKEVVKNEKE